MKKNLLKFITLLLLLTHTSVGLIGQMSTGLVIDEEAYNKLPFRQFFGHSGEQLPERISHRAYTPYPKNQGDIGSCTGYAAGYAAMTTLTAMKYNHRDRDYITSNAYSALFPFHLNMEEARRSESCLLGTNMVKLLEKLKNNGNQLFNEYDKIDSTKCELIDNVQQLGLTNIKGYDRLIKSFRDNNESKINAVKQELGSSGGGVVVVGMLLSNDIKQTERKWEPETEFGDLAHAMCVIGYDDVKREFEIMNSWGADFGDNGYFFIDYDDFANRLNEAYRISINQNFPNIQPTDTVEEESLFTADVDIIKWDYKGYNQWDSIPLQVQYNEEGYYEAEGKFRDGFRVWLNASHNERNVIMVSCNSDKDQLYFNWPDEKSLDDLLLGGPNGNKLISEIPNNGDWAIPSKVGYLQTVDRGTEYFFILYSSRSIDVRNYYRQLKKVKNASNKIETFYEEFKNDLIPTIDIEYQSHELSAVSYTDNDQYIIPIIVKLKN